MLLWLDLIFLDVCVGDTKWYAYFFTKKKDLSVNMNFIKSLDHDSA